MQTFPNIRRILTGLCFTCAITIGPVAWGQGSQEKVSLAQLAIAKNTKQEVLINAAFEQRQKAFLEAIEASKRESVNQLFKKYPRFAHMLLFATQPEDKPVGCADLMLKVSDKHAKAFEAFPSLVAAITLVHDEPWYCDIVENRVTPPDPIETLEYFIENQERLAIHPNQLPPGLLVWVVDTTAQVDEMRWALERYAKHRMVGKTYFDLTYDLDHYKRGIPKKVTQLGYTLPNLKRYGGICADQAYYATMVGKAIGVPTTIAKGEHAESFHAWTGFLHADGKQAAWDFTEGRYPAYRNMRGSIIDPQTRRAVADSIVALSASLYRLNDKQRWEAAALADALQQSIEDEAVSAADKIALFNRVLTNNPHHRNAWSAIVTLAQTGQMTLDQKLGVAKTLMQVSGKRYPDFTIGYLKSIIATVDDVGEQEKLWAGAFELFADRKDVAAEVLMARAAAWSERGETKKAGALYADVIKRYANDGPYVIKALEQTEKHLIELGKADAVPQLYGQTLDRINNPRQFAPQFRKLGNWYRVAVLYKQKLEEAGETRQAAKLQAHIDEMIED